MASVAIYLMIKELTETVEKIGVDIDVGLGLTGTSATGGIGAIIYQALIIVVRAAYAVIMLRAIILMIIAIRMFF